jgi:glycosyltransferase involved in cell wall biosynthesis
VIPYKKFNLLVETFNINWLPLKIVANTKNKLSEHLKSISKENIEWVYEADNAKINILHSKAKAFIFPPEEDFWLVPIAAQASGTPVIAYGKWGALETVIDWKTWVFFDIQTSQSLQKAIDQFESMTFDAFTIRKHAEKFDKSVFKNELLWFIGEKLDS